MKIRLRLRLRARPAQKRDRHLPANTPGEGAAFSGSGQDLGAEQKGPFPPSGSARSNANASV